MKIRNLKGKKVLITAGSTWVGIDKVRVITNVFGGSLGIFLAKVFAKSGASVKLLIGASRNKIKNSGNIKVEEFRYFHELLDKVKTELSEGDYDVMIHSAAVSDYEPVKFYNTKIKSGQRSLIIKLKPTIKIVDLVKKIKPNIFLVKFKLEIGLDRGRLIEVALNSLKKSKADLVVANDFEKMGNRHDAYIIDSEGLILECFGKKDIALKVKEVFLKKIEKSRKN